MAQMAARLLWEQEAVGSSPTTRATGGAVARRVLLTSLFFTLCNGKMGASSLAVRGVRLPPRVAGVRLYGRLAQRAEQQD